MMWRVTMRRWSYEDGGRDRRDVGTNQRTRPQWDEDGWADQEEQDTWNSAATLFLERQWNQGHWEFSTLSPLNVDFSETALKYPPLNPLGQRRVHLSCNLSVVPLIPVRKAHRWTAPSSGSDPTANCSHLWEEEFSPKWVAKDWVCRLVLDLKSALQYGILQASWRWSLCPSLESEERDPDDDGVRFGQAHVVPVIMEEYMSCRQWSFSVYVGQWFTALQDQKPPWNMIPKVWENPAGHYIEV